MATTTTTNPVNLYQLGQEIGGTPSFRMVDNGETRTVKTVDVDQPTLDAAVAAHVADFDIVAPPSAAEVVEATRQTNRTTIDAAIANALAELQQLVNAPAVADVPAGTLTNAQISNVLRSMRDVVQQNRAGIQRVAGTLRQTIRLVRGDFDGVD